MMNIYPIELLNRLWKNLVSGSVNRQILGAALSVGGLTFLVKVVAFAKEAIVASKFGTGDAVDAFLIATVVPSFIVNVVAGSFNAALIPTYIRMREQEGQKAAEKLLASSLLVSLLLLAIMMGITLAIAPVYLPWMTIGFSESKLVLTLQLLYMVSPLILLNGIITIWGAVLNAGERFVLAALSPIAAPAITVILLLFFGRSLGVFALAIGLILGALLEILLLGIALHRSGVVLIPKWFGANPALRQVSQQYAPSMTGAILMCSTGLIDQSMAAMLAPGSVAALTYANRVISFPLALAATALSTVVIPYFSKMVALNNWPDIRHTLISYLKLIFLTTVPFTGLLLLFSESIVKLLFQRGAFTLEQTHIVAQTQSAYALQIPFYIATMLVVKLVTSLRLNNMLMWVSVFNLLINIALNYIFIQWIGIQGIALSTSCVYIFSFFYLLFFTNQNLKKYSTL